MRPGRHKHRERATGYPRGTAHTVGSGGSAIGSTRRPVSIGNGGHGQAAPCSSSGNDHQAGLGIELGSGRFGQVGWALVTVDYGPLSCGN
jgi:hypothetical protein